MDSAKLKKLQDYSTYLTQQAESKEAQGNPAEAAKDYVKLVDVLLVLANESKDHPSWQQLISRAEFYQNKARGLASAPEGNQRGPQQSFNSDSYDISAQRGSATSGALPPSADAESSVLKSFRKIPSIMGLKKDSDLNDGLTINSPSTRNASELTVSPRTVNKDFRPPPSLQNQVTQASPSSRPSPNSQAQSEQTVPYSAYAHLMEEKKKLEKEIEMLQMKEGEYAEAIRSKEHQFAETIADMVPRSEYDEVRRRLEDSIPRSEYQQALTLSSIPRERFIELQARITDLEGRLENSVPRMIVDEIAEYVAYLVSTISLDEGDTKQDKNESKRQKQDAEAQSENSTTMPIPRAAESPRQVSS